MVLVRFLETLKAMKATPTLFDDLVITNYKSPG